MISAWRIVKAKYASDAFSGEGARLAGGRWNSPGVRVVYAAATASLAMLEMLVHLQSHEVMGAYVIIDVRFDESIVETIEASALPRTWKRSPAPPSLRRIGDAWVRQRRSAVLAVPSAVVPAERIYILNPAHAGFATVEIGRPQPVKFDARLLKSAET